MATTNEIIRRPAEPVPPFEPIAVRPAQAWRMLGCGVTRGYQLLNNGELDSFLDGNSRRITVASIHAYIQRKLAVTPKRKNGKSAVIASVKRRSVSRRGK
jgi:hypothetical protein